MFLTTVQQVSSFDSNRVEALRLLLALLSLPLFLDTPSVVRNIKNSRVWFAIITAQPLFLVTRRRVAAVLLVRDDIRAC